MLFKGAIETSALELLLKLQEVELLNGFFLASGTSLAMQIEHRKSIDLDLFTINDFDANKLLEFLEENFEFRMDYSGKNILKGSINDVKIDFILKHFTVKEILNFYNIKYKTRNSFT